MVVMVAMLVAGPAMRRTSAALMGSPLWTRARASGIEPVEQM